MTPKMLTCSADRPSQQWQFVAETGQLKSPHLGMCFEPVLQKATSQHILSLKPCYADSRQQRFKMLPYTGKVPW